MTDTTDDIAEEISFQTFEDDCRLLGSLLNDVLQREVGQRFTEKVERERVLAQSACNMRMAGIEDAAELLERKLAQELSSMTLEEAVPLARAFSHYLNLMGIAETHHRVRRTRSTVHLSKSCDDIFGKMIQSGTPPEELYIAVCHQEVEIVLTAHPTQINRRTLQYKHVRIADVNVVKMLFCYTICLGVSFFSMVDFLEVNEHWKCTQGGTESIAQTIDSLRKQGGL